MHPLEERLVAQSRRQFLRGSGIGVGAFALSALLADRSLASDSLASSANPLAARPPHFAPTAKHVIYLHMIGAPSQLDLFDRKPKLVDHDGEVCPAELLKGKRFAFIGGEMKLAGSKYRYAQHGQSGQEISELLPNLAKVADDITLLKGMHTDEINHAPAQMFLHTGFGRGGRPSFGSWVVYGLGSECENLPAYVVMLSGAAGGAGTSMWSTGFLPSVYQGVQFRSSGDPVLFLSNPKGHSNADRRRVLDTISELNQTRLLDVGDPEIATRINQYEMAFKMQASVPELMDLSSETRSTLDLYGVAPGKPSFAKNCLLARRLVERGVRVIQLFDSDWDHHENLPKRLSAKCKDVDRALGALVIYLKQRGLLDNTLVFWGGYFGRTPLRQTITGAGETTSPGRDHHKDAYTMWLAGGGTKPGITYGKTDDFGFNVVENGIHVHDLNATVLHLLGLDHERLTFTYQGREFRLTDVHGKVVNAILA
jgi:hypothetical protein